MADLARVKIEYTGWSGGPGLSQLHFSQGTTTWTDEVVTGILDEVASGLQSVAALWAPEVVVTVSPEVPIFDSATGDIVDVIVSSEPPSPFQSTAATGAASRATQIVVGLKTGEWKNGRQVQGRFFLGPVTGATITNAGQIASASIDGIINGLEATISGVGPRLTVWSRPKLPLLDNGTWHDVTLIAPSPTPGILSSRRT